MAITPTFYPSASSTNLAIATGFGLVSGSSRVVEFGYNADVDVATVPEDIWEGGGIYPWMTASTSLEILSSSVNDSEVGTGARTVMITGLDINYVQVTQVVTLNGTTPVAIPSPMFRINSTVILSAGSNRVNVGTITVRDVGTSTTRTLISPGVGVSRQSVYTSPVGYTLQILNIYMAITGVGANRSADISTFQQSPLGFYRTPLTFSVRDGSPYRQDGVPGIIVEEKNDFALRCTGVSDNNTSVSTSWLGIIRKN